MAQEIGIYDTSAIAEMTGGIILASYKRQFSVRETSYQSESDLEMKLINNLVSQGYERIYARDKTDLYENLKKQIE